MNETVDFVVFVVLKNPILALGLWLVATSLLLVFQIKHKMLNLGYESVHLLPHPADWELPGHYLEVRSQYGWSPWPVYLMWPCQIAGVLTLLIGLFS
jgi:hypothetical protein